MLKLNHINLSVPDVQQAQQFFETYFDFTVNGTKPNDTLSILSGADGFTLVLMNERMNQKGNHSYPNAFHIGFILNNAEELRAVYDKLKSGGIHLEREPELIRRNLGFYFHHQNVMIEVTCVMNE